MPELLEDCHGGIGGVVALLAEPGLVTREMQQTAVRQSGGVGVVFLDQIVGWGEQIDLDPIGMDPFVQNPLVAGIVASPTRMGACDLLQAGDGGGPLEGTADREDPTVDLVRMAPVGAGFPEAGIHGCPERKGSGFEQGGGFPQTEDIAVEEEVSLKAEVAEGLEFKERPGVSLGTPLAVGPDVSVGRGVDEDASVTMGAQKRITECLRFRAQDDDRARRVVPVPRRNQPPGAREVERVGEHHEAEVRWGGTGFQAGRNAEPPAP